MKKILFTLLLVSLIGLTVNAQTKKVQSSKTQSSTATLASKFADFKTALSTFNLSKVQQSNCREFFIWSARNKERINSDSTLTSVQKLDKINIINKTVNDRLSTVMNAAELKLVAPYFK